MKKIILLLISMIIFSCQNDLDDIKLIDPSEKVFLVFDSFKELNGTLELLTSQNDEILNQRSDVQGFISFHKKSEEIYDLLRNMKYETQKDVFYAFENNNRYVEIIEIDGELEAEPKLSKSIYKYVINEDRIVQVGDSLYKIFDKCIVTTSTSNYQAILQLEDADIQKLAEKNSFTVHNSNTIFQAKTTGHPVDWGDIDKSDEQSKRRVKLEIELYTGGVQLWREFRIAAQKKILGIWFNYNTDITAEIKWRVDFYGIGYGPWDTMSEKYTYDEVYEDVLLVGRAVYFESTDDDDYHFRGYDCTATTDDITNSADLEFYTSAIGYISPEDTYYFD